MIQEQPLTAHALKHFSTLVLYVVESRVKGEATGHKIAKVELHACRIHSKNFMNCMQLGLR